MEKLAIVTGAMSYQGKYLTRILLDRGWRVRTLTNHPERPHEFGDRLEAVKYHFDDPGRLVRDLEGASVFFNTYWVRFNHGATTYGRAVANTQNLIRAAKEAGIGRFVHVSITNPSLDSPYQYFKGKAVLEEMLMESCLSFAIIRPTVLFGVEDILINNICYLLRRLPVFAIPGRGDYRMQPVFVGDVAEMAVELGEQDVNIITDAVGPETYAYADLVRMLRGLVGSRARLVNMPWQAVWALGRALTPLIGDVLVTYDEFGGLMADLLVSNQPPTCPTRFSEWAAAQAAGLGRNYASELKRHY